MTPKTRKIIRYVYLERKYHKTFDRYVRDDMDHIEQDFIKEFECVLAHTDFYIFLRSKFEDINRPATIDEVIEGFIIKKMGVDPIKNKKDFESALSHFKNSNKLISLAKDIINDHNKRPKILRRKLKK